MDDKAMFVRAKSKIEQLQEIINDLEIKMQIKNEFINELNDELNGVIKATGHKDYCGEYKNWSIHDSSIVTKLIKLAAKHCDSYASDLYIQWKDEIDEKLCNGNMETSDYVFAFRDSGIDHKEWYELHKDDKNYYKEVWFLDITVDGNDIKMVLHK